MTPRGSSQGHRRSHRLHAGGNKRGLVTRVGPAAVLALLVAAALVAPATPGGATVGGSGTLRGAGGGDVTAGVSVTGTYTVLLGDFGGGVEDDLLFYAPGSAKDALWLSDGDTTFTKLDLKPQVTGTYRPVVGDFAGDGRSDVIWYAPGPATDHLWTTTGSHTFSSKPLTVTGDYQPTGMDNSSYGPLKDEVVWLKTGGNTGSRWRFAADGTHTAHPVSLLTQHPVPIVGNFDGDQDADLVWWGPGTDIDLYWHNGAGILVTSLQINGSAYRPVVADVDTSGCSTCDDIVWFGPGGISDAWWTGLSNGSFTPHPATIPIQHEAFGLRNPTGDDVVQIWDPGVGNRFWYLSAGSPTIVNAPRFQPTAGYQPIIGDFVGTTEDVFWYRPGPGAEHLVYT